MTEQEGRNLAFLLCLRKIQKNHFPYVHRSLLSTAEFYALFAILRLQEAQDSAGPEIRVSSLIETLNLSPSGFQNPPVTGAKGILQTHYRPQQSP